MGGCKADRVRFFSVVPSPRIRDNAHRKAAESPSLDLLKPVQSPGQQFVGDPA